MHRATNREYAKSEFAAREASVPHILPFDPLAQLKAELAALSRNKKTPDFENPFHGHLIP